MLGVPRGQHLSCSSVAANHPSFYFYFLLHSIMYTVGGWLGSLATITFSHCNSRHPSGTTTTLARQRISTASARASGTARRPRRGPRRPTTSQALCLLVWLVLLLLWLVWSLGWGCLSF